MIGGACAHIAEVTGRCRGLACLGFDRRRRVRRKRRVSGFPAHAHDRFMLYGLLRRRARCVRSNMRCVKLGRNRHVLRRARALLGLDMPDCFLQPLTLGGNDVDIGDVLFAETGFQSLPCRLIDASPDFRIGAIGPIQRASDSRF